MGNEITRDVCPEKFYGKGSVLKNCISPAIALVIVAFCSGSLLKSGGVNIAVVIAVESAFVCLALVAFCFIFKGQAKRLSESYISVCENGVCGVCPQNGMKNKSFALPYNEIAQVTVRGNRLLLHALSGDVYLTLTDAADTAALIRSKSPAL